MQIIVRCTLLILIFENKNMIYIERKKKGKNRQRKGIYTGKNGNIEQYINWDNKDWSIGMNCNKIDSFS